MSCSPHGGSGGDTWDTWLEDIPGLVNVYKKLWKIHPFLMGKSTLSMVIFNSYVINYQRVAGIYLKLWITSEIKSYGFFFYRICLLWVMGYE